MRCDGLVRIEFECVEETGTDPIQTPAQNQCRKQHRIQTTRTVRQIPLPLKSLLAPQLQRFPTDQETANHKKHNNRFVTESRQKVEDLVKEGRRCHRLVIDKQQASRVLNHDKHCRKPSAEIQKIRLSPENHKPNTAKGSRLVSNDTVCDLLTDEHIRCVCEMNTIAGVHVSQ